MKPLYVVASTVVEIPLHDAMALCGLVAIFVSMFLPECGATLLSLFGL